MLVTDKTLGLLSRGFITRSSAFDALYGLRCESEQPDIKVIDVWLVKIRKFLRSHNITLQRQWGEGWWLADADKAKVRALFPQLAAGVPATRAGSSSAPAADGRRVCAAHGCRAGANQKTASGRR